MIGAEEAGFKEPPLTLLFCWGSGEREGCLKTIRNRQSVKGPAD